MTPLKELEQAVMDCKPDEMLEKTKRARETGAPVHDIINDALVAGLGVVGDRFVKGIYFLPELLVAGQGVQAAIDYLEPFMEVTQENQKGKFLMGTVKGDVHDIGKNIVIMMLKCNGWEVTDMGVDVSPEKFCEAIEGGDYDIVGLSALLTMTTPSVTATIRAIKEAGLRSKVKIMIGGAVIDQAFCDTCGADAFGKDAWDAVRKADTLLAYA